MATTQPTLEDEFKRYNKNLDVSLRQKFGMTLKSFKVIKGVIQFTGAAAGIYAMSLGAEPLVALGLITVIISGPEALESAVTNGSGDDTDSSGGGE